jgi:hypothetical protein
MPGELFNIQFVCNDIQPRLSLRALVHLNHLLTTPNLPDYTRKLLFPEPEDAALNAQGSMSLPTTNLTFFDTNLNWAQMVFTLLSYRTFLDVKLT